jgi:hypothetical protein
LKGVREYIGYGGVFFFWVCMITSNIGLYVTSFSCRRCLLMCMWNSSNLFMCLPFLAICSISIISFISAINVGYLRCAAHTHSYVYCPSLHLYVKSRFIWLSCFSDISSLTKYTIVMLSCIGV